MDQAELERHADEWSPVPAVLEDGHCTVFGCDEPTRARSLCDYHYRVWDARR
jgi:hypothetical protein